MKRKNEEGIRLYNADVPSDKGHDLLSCSLTVASGEILGIFGSRYAGKHALLQVLSGERQIRQGHLFLKGRHVPWEDYQSYAKEHMVLIENRSHLIKDLTVWENVALFQGLRDERTLYTPNIQKAMARVLLEEYGVEDFCEASVRELNTLQRLLLEIVIFRNRKTEGLLIDLYQAEGSIYDQYLLGHLLSRLSKEGLMLLVCGQQMELIRQYADRVAVLYKGQIIRTLSRAPGFEQELEYMAGILKRGGSLTQSAARPAGSGESAETLCVLPAELTGIGEDLPLLSGGFTVIKVFDQAVIDRCQKSYEGAHEDARILFFDMEEIDRIIPDLSPLENLCLGILDRTSGNPFIRKRLTEFIRKEFCEWYKHGTEIVSKKHSRGLYHRDRTAINLFRIRLLHKKALLCTDYTIFNDAVSEKLVRESLEEFLREGMAVCMITQNLSFHDDRADRILFAGGKA